MGYLKDKFIKYRRYLYLLLALAAILLMFVAGINLYVNNSTRDFIFSEASEIPAAYTVLVPGSLVKSDGTLSPIVQDRVDKALELYRLKKAKRFLLSGDHGRELYDEVNSMKNYLLKKGVPEEDIFLDHAGFDTYNSMKRAGQIFQADSLIVCTQRFHLPRALFIARRSGLHANGFVADMRMYPAVKRYSIREYPANVKAFLELLINREPKFGGEEIPITGDSRKSFD
jgi:SanA protein